MAILVQQSEATATLRRMYFHCVDATDGISAEVGENGGQPQYSLNGGGWGNTANTLVAIGNGRYYVEMSAGAEVNAVGIIEGRYKSAETAESVGTTLQVVPYDPYLATQPVNMTQIDGDNTNGNNATLNLKSLNIQNNAGDALICHSTGGAGDGASFLGEGAGHGVKMQGGGTSGNGLTTLGGATNGVGFYALGDGAGAGLRADGGDDNGSGIMGVGGVTNGKGLLLTGAGTGAGLKTTGGADGHGIHSIGGATTGNGIFAEAATEGDGIYALAKGTDEHGILAVGGDTTGDGINAIAATDGNGMNLQGAGGNSGLLADGQGIGNGANFRGGADGNGMECRGGATSGDGIYTHAQDGNSHGIQAKGDPTAGGTGDGIYALAGLAGDGLHAKGGSTSGNGIFAEAATEGDGIHALAKGTDEHGIYAVGGDTTGDGIKASAATEGMGIHASALGTAKHGIYAIGGNTSGDGLYATGGTNGNGISGTATGNNNGMSLAGAGTGDGFASVGAAIGKGGSLNVALATTLAVRTSDSVFTLNAGSGVDDAYNNMTISVYDVTGNLKESRKIDDYTGGSKTIEVDTAFKFVVAANDIIRIFESSYAVTVAAGGGATAAEMWQHDVSGYTTPEQAGTYQIIPGGGRYG